MRFLILAALGLALTVGGCDSDDGDGDPTSTAVPATAVRPSPTPAGATGFNRAELAYIDRSHAFLAGVSSRLDAINDLMPGGASPALADEFDGLVEHTDTWADTAPSERLAPYADEFDHAVRICGLAAAQASLAIDQPGSIAWEDVTDGMNSCFNDIIASQELLQSIEPTL